MWVVVPLAQWKEFQELVEKARKYDEITNQPDCEDPEKAAWMRRIEDRLAALEGEVLMADQTIPDVAGGDVNLTAQSPGKDLNPDPVAEARRLAVAIEQENSQRIGSLINLGANPLALQIGIVQTGLGEITSFIPMPPLLRAQFEVAVETAIGGYLDKCHAELSRQRLLGVGVPSRDDVSRLEP